MRLDSDSVRLLHEDTHTHTQTHSLTLNHSSKFSLLGWLDNNVSEIGGGIINGFECLVISLTIDEPLSIRYLLGKGFRCLVQLVMFAGRFGFVLRLAGLGHVGPMDFVKQVFEATSHAEFQNGTTQDVLNIGQSVGDFYQIVLLNGIGQFLDFFLQQTDTEGTTIGRWNRGRFHHRTTKEGVELCDARQGLGHDQGKERVLVQVVALALAVVVDADVVLAFWVAAVALFKMGGKLAGE